MLVGLTGRAGSDKDAAADVLVSRHDFTAYAVSTPLQDALLATDPYLGDRVRLRSLVDDVGWKVALQDGRHGPTVRRYMVSFGSALRSQFGPNILVQHLHRRLVDDYGPGLPRARIVIRDVRLPDEARFVTGLGGRVVAVVRPAVKPLPHDLHGGMPDDLVHGSVTAEGGPDRLDRQLTTLLHLLPAPAKKAR